MCLLDVDSSPGKSSLAKAELPIMSIGQSQTFAESQEKRLVICTRYHQVRNACWHSAIAQISVVQTRIKREPRVWEIRREFRPGPH